MSSPVVSGGIAASILDFCGSQLRENRRVDTDVRLRGVDSWFY
jgi:hypothetical protein